MTISANRSDAERWRRHRAARIVAAQARDAEDLAALLDMLGLSAAEGRCAPSPVVDAGRIPAPMSISDTERNLATTLLADLAQAHR